LTKTNLASQTAPYYLRELLPFFESRTGKFYSLIREVADRVGACYWFHYQ